MRIPASRRTAARKTCATRGCVGRTPVCQTLQAPPPNFDDAAAGFDEEAAGSPKNNCLRPLDLLVHEGQEEQEGQAEQHEPRLLTAGEPRLRVIDEPRLVPDATESWEVVSGEADQQQTRSTAMPPRARANIGIRAARQSLCAPQCRHGCCSSDHLHDYPCRY